VITTSPEYTIELSNRDYNLLESMAYENNMEIGDLISEMINEKTELMALDVNLNKAPDSFQLLADDVYLTESDEFKDEFNEL
jgi:hypothetical protein